MAFSAPNRVRADHLQRVRPHSLGSIQNLVRRPVNMAVLTMLTVSLGSVDLDPCVSTGLEGYVLARV